MRHLAMTRLTATLLVVGTLVLPSTGVAQQSLAPTDSTRTAVVAPAAPAPLGTQPQGVALSRRTAPADSATPPPAPSDNNHGNTVLMLAGAATIIAGAVVGGDGGNILIIGGAVLGVFGLFRYLTH